MPPNTSAVVRACLRQAACLTLTLTLTLALAVLESTLHTSYTNTDNKPINRNKKKHVHPVAIVRTATAEQLDCLVKMGVNFFAKILVSELNDAIFFVYLC